MSDPATGEKYHVEVSYGFWNPDLEATISSEQLGIIGSEIDVKSDLGYTDEAIRQFRLVLRPGRKHKFRIEYIPIKFEGDTILNRTIVFNGIEFNVGLPVQTSVRMGHLAPWLRVRLRLHRPRLCGIHPRGAADDGAAAAGQPHRQRVHRGQGPHPRHRRRDPRLPGEAVLDYR